ncbi:unnamed protein product, partial [Effrenium voratum]
EIAVQPAVSVPAGGSTASSEASSTPGTPMAGASGEGRLVQRAVLALQLRWREGTDEEGWPAERRRALEALRRLRPPKSESTRRAAVVRRKDTVSREEFEARTVACGTEVVAMDFPKSDVRFCCSI